jgi:thiol-disulfide isomerase/thioredoxin
VSAPGRAAGFLRAAWVRWLLVAVVLVIALAVAIWPRGNPTQAAVTLPQPDLSAARARAALPDCPHPTAAAPAGSPLRGITVTCAADGRSVPLAGVLAGGPVLVNVWASWCQPCHDELPVLAGYAASAGAVPVFELEVQHDEQAGGLAELAGLGVRLPTAFDATGAAQRALRVPDSLPASYLVHPDGTATLIADTRVFGSAEQIRAAVTRYTPEGAGR